MGCRVELAQSAGRRGVWQKQIERGEGMGGVLYTTFMSFMWDGVLPFCHFKKKTLCRSPGCVSVHRVVFFVRVLQEDLRGDAAGW